jgi:starch phosphorylase
VVFVTLISHAGYFRQNRCLGAQSEHEDAWKPEEWWSLRHRCRHRDQKREFGSGRDCHHHCPSVTPSLSCCSTDLDENAGMIGRSRIGYGGDNYRLKQEIVLGVGGVRVLQALDSPSPRIISAEDILRS